MSWSLDARIPLRCVTPAELPAALATAKGSAATLTFGDAASPHPAVCTCCAGRTAAAEALDRLFQARVRGTCAWFDVVLAVVDGKPSRDAVLATLDTDAVTRARFRAV